ncbi:hypothetical protein O5O45_07820 [Hahella aquimaris]|uniref:hypothetical protein n=1 Tax=Hahella sp. HNIBRBA332 TaxID=3015983 RepID=UPI00273C8223|nr:hypothetical protein [Hahella sp. HNIBRBA332]WLQ15819.1 hypothetical protein O5O45_07820 [Hahella sp. HNIBRBA332]
MKNKKIVTAFPLLFRCMALAGIALLSACSDSSSDAGYADDDAADTPPDYSADSDMDIQDDVLDWNPANDGWRKGRLFVELRIEQEGSKVEHKVHQGLSGPETTQIDWTYSLVANGDQAVWTRPDLDKLTPDMDPEYGRSSWESEPYMPLNDDSELVVQGNVKVSLYFDSQTPDASDYVRTMREVSAEGKVSGLTIKALQPSLFGQGYELSAEWEPSLNVRDITTLTDRKGANQVLDESGAFNEPIKLRLYPALNPDGINDYPLAANDDPADVKAGMKKFEQEIWQSLQQLSDAPILGEGRTGLVTEQSKDSLTLTYEYSGDKQMPYWPSLETLAAKPDKKNTMKVRVRLQVD